VDWFDMPFNAIFARQNSFMSLSNFGCVIPFGAKFVKVLCIFLVLTLVLIENCFIPWTG